jgi:hypothetical protein
MLQTVNIFIHSNTWRYPLHIIQMHKEMTRTGHTFRGNQLYIITRHHTVTLNMVNSLLLEILYIISDTRKSRMGGDALQEHKYCREELHTET